MKAEEIKEYKDLTAYINETKWICFLFGTYKMKDATFTLNTNDAPNWFIRWMQEIILGNKWTRNEKYKEVQDATNRTSKDRSKT